MKVLLASTNRSILRHLNAILDGGARLCYDMLFLDKEIESAANTNTIVCLDVSNLDGDPFLSVQDFMQDYPNLRILALSEYPNMQEGSRLLELGVRGYVNSRLYDTHLKDAIKAIEDGNVWLYPDFIYSMVKIVSKSSNLNKNGFDELTEREKEVARLALDGLSNKEIALILDLSERTIKAHLSNIYAKFGVKDRIAFVLAMKN